MDKEFNIEEWRKEHPIDYEIALNLLRQCKSTMEINLMFMQLYKVYRLYVPNILFKYYSLADDKKLNNAKLDTLLNGKIYMSDPKDFNDPFDEKGYFYKSEALLEFEKLKQYNGKLIDDFSAYSKATSLTGNDYNSMPMWAHYGNNHKGFCVSYNMEEEKNSNLKSCTFKVQYIDKRIDVTPQLYEFSRHLFSRMEESQKTGQREIVLDDLTIIYIIVLLANVKNSAWSYEDEYRCTNGYNAPGMPYIDAIPFKIYIGMNCEKEYEMRLIEIAKKFNIDIYKMKYAEENTDYALIAEKIYY